MAIHDLTHLMHSQMPVYPGKRQPVIENSATLDKDGYREMHLQIDGHTGTHMDAPAHMLLNGRTLDVYPAAKFTGRAVIVPVPDGKSLIEIADLKPYETEIRKAGFVLFRTGWSNYWGTNQYLDNFPVLSEVSANWLTTFQLKGVGIDSISVDTIDSVTWPVHHVFFNNDLIIIENLKFPSDLKDGSGTFHCYPLLFENADGSPVRALFFD
jgi:arylformamidase